MQIQSVGWENPLGEEMATHSSILAWEIPWMEEPDWRQSKMLPRKKKCCKALDTTEHRACKLLLKFVWKPETTGIAKTTLRRINRAETLNLKLTMTLQ